MLKRWRRNSPRYFLARSETKKLTERISAFERATGCELIFHFRRKLGPEPVLKNHELFQRFKLHETSDHRAILVTLAVQERSFAVWADEGVEKHAGRELHKQVAGHLGKLKAADHLTPLLGAIDSMQELLNSSATSAHVHSRNELSDAPIVEDDEE